MKRFFKKLYLKWKFFWVNLIYLTYTPQAILYSYKRDRADRNIPPLQPHSSETGDTPGKLLKAENTETGTIFNFEKAELELTFLTNDFVRITWKPTILPYPYGIERQEWETLEPLLNQTENAWTVTSPNATLTIQVQDEGHLKFFDAQHQLIREEYPPEKLNEQWIHRANLRPEEHIYGLGERSFPLNLRLAKEVTKKGKPTSEPKKFRMWNFDAAGQYSPGSDPMYLCIPLYLGLHEQGSYLIFYENPYEAIFQFSDTATANFSGGALRYYFTLGSLPKLIENYTELTGRSPLPPRWTLGYHHSRWGFGTETQVRETYRNFEKNDLPLSAIHLDIDVMVDYQAFTIDPKRFPDLQRFIQELEVHGVKFISILNPGVKYTRHNQMFLQGQILHGFCKYPNGKLVIAPVWPGWTVFPDFTHPMVRRWWTRQYLYLLEVGVGGFWHDMNEPAAFIAWGDRSLPKVTRHFVEGRGGDHREIHNVYGMLQASAAFESLRQSRPHHRPFIVSRAGWAGLQRYAWVWTGDIESSWAALRQTISTVIGLGLSGISYSGSDTGGFQGNPSAELYLRWFQMSSFMMFYRTHSSNNVEHRTPWIYGEPTLSILREFLKFRYRLIPYIYTLTRETHQKGYPPVRPIFWLDPTDSNLWDIDDAFLLGNALMICPIYQPGMRSRNVYLPPGEWYHFWDDQPLKGSQIVEFDAPLERIPLLIKAGSIIPMEEGKTLILHLYPTRERNAQGLLYSDAGDGYETSRIDQFQLQPSFTSATTNQLLPVLLANTESDQIESSGNSMKQDGNSMTLIWEQQGDYPFSYQQIQLQLHGFNLQKAWIDDLEITCKNNSIICDRPFQQARLIATL